jgi:hypothetical protein
MSKLILPGKAYLILWGENKELESQLTKMGERIGFRYVKVESQQELQDSISKIKTLVAMIYCNDGSNVLPMFPALGDKFLEYKKETSVVSLLEHLDKLIIKGIPPRLTDLITDAIKGVTPKLLGAEFTNLSRSSDFSIHFTNLITCDSSAEAFSAKALCKVNFERLRHEYKSLSQRTDSQLIDLFGEFCNQLLGVINASLRPIGLSPLISLPIGAELSRSGSISQVDYMPMIRFIDLKQVFGVGVSVSVGSKCQARWNELVTKAASGELEFF